MIQQDLDGYLLVVELQDESTWTIFGISSLRRSCLVGVDVSCSGFMEAVSRRSLGLRPMANSMGVLPLKVTCVFLTVAALRINWAGVNLCQSGLVQVSGGYPRVPRETS